MQQRRWGEWAPSEVFGATRTHDAEVLFEVGTQQGRGREQEVEDTAECSVCMKRVCKCMGKLDTERESEHVNCWRIIVWKSEIEKQYVCELLVLLCGRGRERAYVKYWLTHVV